MVAPDFVRALGGHGTHVLTFNDYLARRDAAWMGPIYQLLGLSVGVIQDGMSSAERRKADARDITYATAKEAGFDQGVRRRDLLHGRHGVRTAAVSLSVDVLMPGEVRML